MSSGSLFFLSLSLQVKFALNTETGEKVAVKILDKDKIQKQNMGAQIKKEVRVPLFSQLLRNSGGPTQRLDRVASFRHFF